MRYIMPGTIYCIKVMVGGIFLHKSNGWRYFLKNKLKNIDHSILIYSILIYSILF